MAFLPTNASQVQQWAGALYGITVGSATLAQVNADIAAVGGLNNALNAYYKASFGLTPTATVAATIATNLGLTGSAKDAAVAYITGQLNNAGDAKGAAVNNMLNLFLSLTSDPTFGAAATAWSQTVEKAVSYTGTTNQSLTSTTASPTGLTFVLTTGIDNFTGTAGDDTFIGVISDNSSASPSTWNNGGADVVAGGAGYDTLKLFQEEENTDVYVLTAPGIEHLMYQTSDEDELYLSGMTDIQKITVFQSSDTGNDFYDVANRVDVAFEGNVDDVDAYIEVLDTVDEGEVSLTLKNNGSNSVELYYVNETGDDIVTSYAITATGTNDDVYLDNTEVTTAVTVAGTGSLDLELDDTDVLTSVSAASYEGDLTLQALTATKDLTVTGGSGDDSVTVTARNSATATDTVTASLVGGAGDDTLTLTSGTGLQALSVDGGAGKDTLVVNGGNASTTASKATVSGGDDADTITITSDAEVAFTVDGGAGDDKVTLAAALQSKDTVAGGDGTDNLVGASATIVGIATTANLYDGVSGFEKVTVSDALGANLSLSKLAGVVTLELQAAITADRTISGVASGFTLAYTAAADSGHGIVIDMTGATNANTPSDTLNISLNANIANNANHIVEFGLDGINVVNVTAADSNNKDKATSSNDGYTVVFDNGGSDSNITTLNIAGSSKVTYTASATASAIALVNGSASTGDLAIDFSGFTGTQGVEFKLGTGTTNSVTGTAKADIITAISGTNTLIGGAGADVITGGTGDDTITGGTGADNITLGGGADTLNVAAGDAGATGGEKVTGFVIGATKATTLNLDTTTKIADAAVAVNVVTALTSGTADDTLTATVTNGVITLAGNATAKVDTVTELVAIFQALDANNSAEVGAIVMGGNTYVITDAASGNGANADSVNDVIQLVGVTGVTALVTTAAANSILIS